MDWIEADKASLTGGATAMTVIDECHHCQHLICGVQDELTNLTDGCGRSRRCN